MNERFTDMTLKKENHETKKLRIFVEL